jgi:hypothetical protein
MVFAARQELHMILNILLIADAGHGISARCLNIQLLPFFHAVNSPTPPESLRTPTFCEFHL